MTNDAKWGWCFEGCEEAHGPFDTKEEAIADAQENVPSAPSTGTKVMIGRCEYADPAYCIEDDIDTVLDQMDQVAIDNGCVADYCDPVFEVPDEHKGEAQDELRKALQSWAKKWCTSNRWVLERMEPITMKPGEQKQ